MTDDDMSFSLWGPGSCVWNGPDGAMNRTDQWNSSDRAVFPGNSNETAAHTEVSGERNSSDANSGGDCGDRDSVTTEDILQQMVNSNDGWGKRAINQSNAWDLSELDARMVDRRDRSSQPTPTPNLPNPGLSGFTMTSGQEVGPEPSMWPNGTPTGTRIWELHYETMGVRTPFRPDSTIQRVIGMPPPINDINIHSRPESDFDASFTSWNNEPNMWRSGFGASSDAVIGRPLLGARGSQPPEGGWGGSTLDSGNMDHRNSRTWNETSAGSSQLRSMASPQMISSGHEDLRRFQSINPVLVGQMLNNGPYNTQNQGRPDQKAIFSQRMGRMGDVTCPPNNGSGLFDMVPDANNSLNRGRVRLGACAGPSQVVGGLTGLMDIPSSSLNQPPSCIMPSFPRPPKQQQNVFPVTAGGAPFGNQAVSPSPQTGHMRQQLPQQARSAMNLPISNSLNGSTLASGMQTSTGAAIGSSGGGSLLGQPPPPLLNNNNFNPSVLSVGPAGCNGPSLTPGLPTPLNRGAMNQGPGPSVGASKRNARSNSLINSITELQNKRQSIQQQYILYKNNPNLCSQPQYADVCNELQYQMQHIENQLQIKQNQLQALLASQDGPNAQTGSSYLLSQHGIPMSSAHNLSATSPSAVPFPSMDGQDLLSQQLTQMRLRSQGPDENQSDLYIGTWIPKSRTDSSDLPSEANSRGANGRATTSIGAGSSRGPGGGNNWQQSVAITNDQYSRFGGALPGMHGPDSQHQDDGHWLLVRVALDATSNNDGHPMTQFISHLSSFPDPVRFHVLNADSGHALLHLQSPGAFQRLKKNLLDDNVSLVQTLSSVEARRYIERFKPWNSDCRPSASNQFNPLSSDTNAQATFAPWNGSNPGTIIGTCPPQFSGPSSIGVNVGGNGGRKNNQNMQNIGQQRDRGIPGSIH